MADSAPSALKLIIFDCDSTLSAIEGIDELARLRGEAVFAASEAMTNDAMDGRLRVEEVFAKRLELIQPTAADVIAVGERYIATVEPSARTVIAALKSEGWTPIIVSGGFRAPIRPLADYLGIERIEAVDLYFDPLTGAYAGYDEAFPTTRSGGKPEIMTQLRSELNPARIVMVGDGASDLETKPKVDLFVGFGRYLQRERVRAGAEHFIQDLAELPPILATI